ncbi:putative invasin [Xenorhabdus beddingii]|uniref:Putative invasin n=1 Tax=Xenorhabdus beddingii TaxID=40578 RepID=A0A1Y2SQ05_9GAMM|nr:inverse autotransporter beta domain-containing protein [Xenorhabdus beddingii]OTA19833.1 putative invasin [Xenorhabdus beddingii]
MSVLQKSQSSLFSGAKSLIIGLLGVLLSVHNQAVPQRKNENTNAQTLAEITSQWRQLTRSQSPFEAAQTMAAQRLSSAVTSTLTPWFNQYGNARMTLPFDRHFSLKDTAFEWLYEEWGNFYLYDGWWREFYVTSTDYLAAGSGSTEHLAKWAFWAGTGRWTRNAWAMTAFACGQ